MRVLQVLPSIKSASGGPPRSTLATCRVLHAVDPEVETVLLTTDEKLGPDWKAELLASCPDRMDVQILPGIGRHTGRFSLSLLRWMRRHGGEFDLAVIQALLHPLSSAAARVARSQGLPYLLVPHGTLSRYTFNHRRTLLKRLYYRLVEEKTVSRAAALRFTTQAERDDALRLGIRTCAAVIPHPYESTDSRLPSDSPMESHSDTASGGHVLFLSRLHPVKGVDLLLEAFQRIAAARNETSLTLAGSGSSGYESEIRNRIRDLGLEHRVRLPGFVDGEAKRDLLEKADVFVLPSHHESFGMVLVEAMDAGCPVVTTRAVGLFPDIKSARAGRVVGARPEPIASAVIDLLTDPAARYAMGRAGREMVREEFHPETVAQELRRLYRAAARGPERVQEAFS